MDSIYLSGSEAVQQASYKMAQAAESMERTVTHLDFILQQNQQNMENWLSRLEAIFSSPVKSVT